MDFNVMPDEQFLEECFEVDSLICEEIFPILDQIGEDYPDQDAFFTMFVSVMDALFHQGWTPEELCQEVVEHHVLFVEHECEDLDPSKLQ